MVSETNYDPLDLDGQAKEKREQKVLARLSAENEESDLKWLMSSRRGRRIVWRILDQSGVFRTVFNTNAVQMAFNEGCRNYGLQTLAMVQNHCSELFHTMQKEATNGRGTA